jgi:hypothetical protein
MADKPVSLSAWRQKRAEAACEPEGGGLLVPGTLRVPLQQGLGGRSRCTAERCLWLSPSAITPTEHAVSGQ